MDVHTGSFLGLPSSVLLDAVKGPSTESEECGTTMLEAVPGVGRETKGFTLGGEPWVESCLVDGEDVVIWAVWYREGEDDEGIEGRRKESDIGSLALLIGFGEGHPEVPFEEKGVAPTEEEDFTGAYERVEAEGEEGVVMDLEGSLLGEEEVQVFEGYPELRTGSAVDAVVGTKSKRGERGEGGREAVDLAPELDGRGG